MTPTLDEAYEELFYKQNVQPLKDYLAAGGKITAKRTFPFYYSVLVVRDIELVITLFDRGMSVSAEWNFFGHIEDMSDEVFRWALEKNFDKLEYGIPVVHFAFNHRERFVELLQRGMDIYAMGRSCKYTAMVSAVGENNIAGIELLYEAGLDINHPSEFPAVHRAVYGDVGIKTFKLLIRLGADPGTRTKKGKDTMMVLCDSVYPGRDSLEKIKFISLVYPSWASARDNDGNTALHFAIFCGHCDFVSLLLSLGADYTIKNNNGRDPVDSVIYVDNLVGFRRFFDYWKYRSMPIDYPGLFAKCEAHKADEIKQFLVETQLEAVSIDADTCESAEKSIEKQLDSMMVEND